MHLQKPWPGAISETSRSSNEFLRLSRPAGEGTFFIGIPATSAFHSIFSRMFKFAPYHNVTFRRRP